MGIRGLIFFGYVSVSKKMKGEISKIILAALAGARLRYLPVAWQL